MHPTDNGNTKLVFKPKQGTGPSRQGGARITRANPLMRSGIFLCSLFLAACVNPQSGTSDFSSSWVRPEDPQEQIGQKEHPVIVA
ncbi:MAG: hypothetical protein AAFN43_02945, partial [Pseudomonadota bacterium]